MNTPKLIEQLELYSNAITGFVVVQSLGFAFTLGTNSTFACLAFTQRGLNFGLVIHFILTLLLAVVALLFLSRTVVKLSQENRALVRRLYFGKAVAVAVFVALPVVILTAYGSSTLPPQACKVATK